MKKIVSILMCLLCVASASAVTYGNPYKGAGRNGYVGTGYRAAGSGMSQAPTATMRTTSSVSYSTAYAGMTQAVSSMANKQVQGMYTAASAVRGGVTSCQTYSAMSGARYQASGRRNSPSLGDVTDGCECIWIDNGDGTYTCSICDHTITKDEYLDGECCDCDPCRCPLGDGWDVWIMLAVMAVGYAWFVRRRRVKSIVKP